jgi:hypothetical protein
MVVRVNSLSAQPPFTLREQAGAENTRSANNHSGPDRSVLLPICGPRTASEAVGPPRLQVIRKFFSVASHALWCFAEVSALLVAGLLMLAGGAITGGTV